MKDICKLKKINILKQHTEHISTTYTISIEKFLNNKEFIKFVNDSNGEYNLDGIQSIKNAIHNFVYEDEDFLIDASDSDDVIVEREVNYSDVELEDIEVY